MEKTWDYRIVKSWKKKIVHINDQSIIKLIKLITCGL